MGIQHSLSPLFTVIAFFLFLSSLYGQSNAARNVTVDDSDAAIEYEGIWDPEPASDPASQGGSHKVANDPSAKAMFKFNGTAVYVWFPKWSYGVSALLSLDGSDPELVNLEDDTKDPSDSAVDPSTVLRYWDGLDDGMEHTLMFEKGPGFLVLDMITYTASDLVSDTPASPSPSTTPTRSTTRASPSPSPSSANIATPPNDNENRMRTVMIAVGVVIGILSLLSIPLIIMFCHRRRQRAKDEAAKMNFSVDPEPQKTFDSGYKSHPSIEINVSGPVNVHNSAAAPHHHISTSPTRPAYVNFNAAQRYPGGYAPAPASRQATTGHGPAHSQGYGSRDALTRDLERVGQDYTHLKNREHANRSGVLPSSRPIQSPRVPNSPPTSPQITHGQSLGPLMVSNAASNDGHSSPEPGASAPLEQHERARRQDSVDSQASTASGATIGTITDGYGTGLGARGFKLTIPLSRESKAWEAAMDREVEEMEAPPYKARNTLPPAYPGLSHDLPGAPLPSTSVLPPTPPAYSQSSATPVPAVSLSRAPRPKRSGLTQVRKAAEQARTLDDSRRAGMLTRGDANRSVTVAPKRETRIATLYNPWDEARHAEDARASGTFEGTTLVDSAPIRGLKSELVVLSPSRG